MHFVLINDLIDCLDRVDWFSVDEVVDEPNKPSTINVRILRQFLKNQRAEASSVSSSFTPTFNINRRVKIESAHPQKPRQTRLQCSHRTCCVLARGIAAIIDVHTPTAEWSHFQAVCAYARLPLSEINKFTPTLWGLLKGIMGNAGIHWLKWKQTGKWVHPGWWQEHCTSRIHDITVSEGGCSLKFQRHIWHSGVFWVICSSLAEFSVFKGSVVDDLKLLSLVARWVTLAHWWLPGPWCAHSRCGGRGGGSSAAPPSITVVLWVSGD